MGSFLNNPGLRRPTVYSEDYDPERPWMLLEDLKYYSEVLGKYILVPKGYRTDFASVPWFFRRVFPQDGDHNLAAIVHDYLCDHRLVDHVTAAKVLREGLLDLQVGAVQAFVWYWGVRLFGPRFTKEYPNGTRETPKS